MNYQLVTLALALSLAMASQPALADTANINTKVTTGESSAPPSPAPDKDSVKQEKEDTKAQIESSAPGESPVGGNLPASGAVMVTPKQKQSAANEASAIVDHGPQPTIPASMYGRPTIALALGGGGARGAAHLGVLRVFEREHIPVDYIVGNSMGAIVGGMYASGLSIDKIKECMDDGSMRHAYMPMSISSKLLASGAQKLASPFLPKHYAGLFSGEKFTKYLDSVLPEPNMNVQDTKIPFSAVGTNLLDGKAYRLSEGRLSTVLKASSAISPIIQPVAIGDKLYVDGGVRANLPVMAAHETGAGIVIAVLVDEPLVEYPAKHFVHLKGIASRLADIVLAVSDERQLQYADVVINPNVSGVAILSKHPEDIQKAYRAGELAAEKALPEIRAALKRGPRSNASVAAHGGSVE
jgi:NTE family protein